MNAIPDMTIYQNALMRLPGVAGSGIGLAESGGYRLDVMTETAADAAFLDRLVEDELGGLPVTYTVTGRFEPEAAPTGARLPDVVAEFGPAIAGLPGVVAVGAGTALEILVAGPDEAAFLQEFLEDCIDGVPVVIRS